MIEQMKSIAMNFYLFAGGSLGVVYNFFAGNLESIALTFILGFVGAAGGAVAKLLVDKIKTKEDDK